RNAGAEERELSATFYAEWVLGTNREQTALYVVTEEDQEGGALLARNAFSPDFAGVVAFLDVSLRPRTLTGDRAEFIGRNRSLASPAGMEQEELSGRTGPGLDPCACVQGKFRLEPGEEKVVVFVLGEGPDAGGARHLAGRYRRVEAAEEALGEVV